MVNHAQFQMWDFRSSLILQAQYIYKLDTWYFHSNGDDTSRSKYTCVSNGCICM